MLVDAISSKYTCRWVLLMWVALLPVATNANFKEVPNPTLQVFSVHLWETMQLVMYYRDPSWHELWHRHIPIQFPQFPLLAADQGGEKLLRNHWTLWRTTCAEHLWATGKKTSSANRIQRLNKPLEKKHVTSCNKVMLHWCIGTWPNMLNSIVCKPVRSTSKTHLMWTSGWRCVIYSFLGCLVLLTYVHLI